MWCVVLFAAISVEEAAPGNAVQGTARQAATANFLVASHELKQDARQIAELCEQWREKLLATWRPHEPDTAWKLPCQVVVHASRQSYVAAVGRGGQSSHGSSWIDLGNKETPQRRIDLLPSQKGVLSALPHEMTHVTMADAFGGKLLPLWADEGMAVLADDLQKRRLHQRDLETAFTQRQAFACAELLTIGNYPPPSRVPAFYGQSASVVAYLCRRDKPAKFLQFMQLAVQKGHDAALKDVYGLASVFELEYHWKRDLPAAIDFHAFQLSLADSPRTKEVVTP